MRPEFLPTVLLASLALLWTSACGDDGTNSPQDSDAPPSSTFASEDDASLSTDGDAPTDDAGPTDGSGDTDGDDPTDGNGDSDGETSTNPCDGVDCTSLDSDCSTGVCNPGTGDCTTVAMNNDSPCNTGDLCSTGVCIGGSCEATPLDCSNLNETCAQGLCDPDTGNCEAVPAHEGETCDDGDLCTESTCTAGTCTGPALDCSALDDECLVGSCDASTGTCVAASASEGEPCDDGDACTMSICAEGTCAGPPVDCSAASDDCNEGTCNPDTGACEPSPANEGEECRDDELRCLAGTCTAGVCEDALPVDCEALVDECNVGICLNDTGECQAAPVNEGGDCDDGDPCTSGTTCTDGACGGGANEC